MLLPSSSSQRQHFNTNTINENRQQDAHTTNGGPLCSPSTITKTNQGPTYDFSVHSCSLSPSSFGGEGDTATIPDSGCVPLGGSLVTHKPRGGFLAKNRILKKFRSGIGSSSTKKKKSRKAFAIQWIVREYLLLCILDVDILPRSTTAFMDERALSHVQIKFTNYDQFYSSYFSRQKLGPPDFKCSLKCSSSAGNLL